MTRDEFSSRYSLLKTRGDGPGRSYTAEHRSSGRLVQVHFIEGGQAGPGAELLRLVERLAPADRTKVLETLTVDDSIAFVTESLPGGQEFEPWLRSAAGVGGPAAASPASPAAGEFTALFRAGDQAAPTSAPPPPAAPAAPAAGGSSFTEMFRAPVGQPTPPPAPAQGAGSTAPPVRVVGLRVPTPPAPIRQEAAGQPARQEPPGQGPALPVPTPHLGPGAAPSTPAPPPLEPPAPRPAALYAPGPAAPPPLQPGPWSGPSDFTRQLNPAAQFTGPVPVLPGPPDAGTAPPEHRKTSYLPLFVALNLAFIIITGLVLYFALRRC